MQMTKICHAVNYGTTAESTFRAKGKKGGGNNELGSAAMKMTARKHRKKG